MSGYGDFQSNGVEPGAKRESVEDTLQRARQIATKIDGDDVQSNNEPESFPFMSQKRYLDETEEPNPKKLASQNGRDSAMSPFAGLSQQSLASTVQEDYRVPESMVGLIIGKGGEQINKIQKESRCKVVVAPDGTGLFERSVYLTGPLEAREAAKAIIENILSRNNELHNGQAGCVVQLIIPAGKAGLIIGKGGEKIKQLQERTGVKMVLIQDGCHQSNIDKPLRITGDPRKVQMAKDLVNEILRDHGGFGDRNEYRSGVGGGGIEIAVPRQAVGVVIGRNGEMIKKIQNDAGVKIQFIRDDGTSPEKMAAILGPPDRCQYAASIITDLLRAIWGREGGGHGGLPGPGDGMLFGGQSWGTGQDNWRPDEEVTFSIPAYKCGLVIGRGGETIKSINQQTGANLEISRHPPPNCDPNFKLFILRGSPEQIDDAKQLVEEKIESPICLVGGGHRAPTGPHNLGLYNAGSPVEAPCGAAPSNPQYCPPDWGNNYQPWKTPNPHGSTDKAGGDRNAAWAAYYAEYYGQEPGVAMSSQTPGSRGDQHQLAQTSGVQPDYTKAWEEYYRTMGMNQSAGGGAVGHSSAGPTEAAGPAGGRQDYSAAWAEYYRQQAALYGQKAPSSGQMTRP